MLLVKQLTITAFRSVEDTLVLDFNHNKYGIIFVEGVNKVEPELGSNGAGKSTLWSALAWVLFGKTETNLRADMVANWSTNKQCCVRLVFELNGVEYTLERTHKPNKLSLNGEVITQDSLENMLNIDFASFLYSVYISQFGSKFLELTPSNKMSVFTSVIGKELGKWLDYSEVASKLAGMLKLTIEECKQTIATYNGIIESIDIDGLKQQQVLFEEKRKTVVDKLKATISELKLNSKNFSVKTKELESAVQDVKNKQKEVDSKLKKLSSYGNDVEARLTFLDEEISKCKATINSSETEKRRLERLLLESKCPTCGQPLDKVNSESKKLIKTLDNLIKTSSDTLNDLQKERNKIIREGKERDSQREIFTAEYNKLVRKEGELKSELASVVTKQGSQDKELETLSNRIKEAEEQANPFDSMIHEAKRKLAITQRLREYEKMELDDLEKKLLAVEYWKKGFKNIRLMILDESLKELEIHINNNLQSLGMSDWSITLEVESETQKGTLQREFTVFVEAPHGGGKLPLEVWSGGEGQRLRLAGTLGLMDFIHNRRGTDWNIEIFDEPSQYLSETGIESLLDVLDLRAKRLNKQIIFADHRGLSAYGKFVDTIKVAKTDKGTVLIKPINK